MSRKYFAPGVKGEEIDQTDDTIRGAPSGVSLMQLPCRKGPVNVPRGPFRGLSDWEAVYGGPSHDYLAWYYVRGYFKQFEGAELFWNRIAHYSDITNPSTRTGTVASRTLATADGGPSAAKYDATLAVAPYVLQHAWTFILHIDNDGTGPHTATFNGLPADLECANAETYNLVGGETLTVKVDKGAVQTVTMQGGDIAVGGAATAEEVAQRINQDLVGASASATSAATKVTIASDKAGLGSYIQVTGGTGTMPSELGFSASEIQGTGNVQDIRAVTFAEAQTLIQAATTPTCIVEQMGGGFMRITSPTTGVLSEVDVQGGTAITALGFTPGVGVGAASTVANTLRLDFGWKGYDSPGVEPNGHLKTQVYKDPLHVSAGAGNDLAADTAASAVSAQLLTLEGLEVGSVVKFWEGSNSEYRVLTKVQTEISGGLANHMIYWEGVLLNVYTAAAGMFESREFTVDVFWDDDDSAVETFDGLSMLDTHDRYVETVINDEGTGSNYVMAVDQDSVIGLGADIPATDSTPTAMTVAGTSEIVGLTGTDFIGHESAELGIYACETIALLVDQVAYPGRQDVVASHHLSQWCEEHLMILPTFSVPLGYGKDAAAVYRSATLALYSKFGTLEYPGVEVFDPLSAASRPTIVITPEAHVMGKRAAVDAIPGISDGGVWSAAAGQSGFGRLKDVMGLERDVTEKDQRTLNPISVNCLRAFPGGVYRYGARTLSSNIKWRYENVVRFFMFLEKSFVTGTRWAVFRNNNFRLWDKVRERGDDFLTDLSKDRAFPERDNADNFFIKVGIDDGVMDEGDRDDGKMISIVGAKPNPLTEFVVFRFTQFKGGGFEIEEL